MEKKHENKLDNSELLRIVYSEDHVESENDKYIGELSNGKRSGYGILLYSNGNRYLGQFEENHFCGEGIFYFKNGDFFQGTFHQSLLNGMGRYKSKNGYEYNGYWLNGMKNGWGRMRNQTVWTYNSETYMPEIYDGDWIDDLYHGEGLHENDGIRYYGSWERGIKHGYGKQKNHEYGYRYEGFFSNNKFEVQGVLTFNDKSFYDGKFKDGKPNGYGYYQDINKVKHHGDWKDGFCIDLLNKYIEEIIDKYFRKEFEKLKALKIEWDVIYDGWKMHLSSPDSDDKNKEFFVVEINRKLLDLDIYLADFDLLIEEDLHPKINNYFGKDNQYYCCDFANLWGEVPNPYEVFKESMLYKNREILYDYYITISEYYGH